MSDTIRDIPTIAHKLLRAEQFGDAQAACQHVLVGARQPAATRESLQFLLTALGCLVANDAADGGDPNAPLRELSAYLHAGR